MQIIISNVSYNINEADLNDIKLLLIYAEFLGNEGEKSALERLHNFFIGTPKDANLNAIQDLIRPDIFLNTPIQFEMQRIFALLVRYRNDYKFGSNASVLKFEQNQYASRIAIRQILKAIFIKLDKDLVNTIFKTEVGKESEKSFREKILRAEAIPKDTRGIELKEDAEMDFVAVVKPINYRNNNEVNKRILLLEGGLNTIFKILEDNTDMDEIQAIKTQIAMLHLSSNTEKTAISISRQTSLAQFLEENAAELTDAKQRDKMETALSRKYGHLGIFMLAAADMYCLAKDYWGKHPVLSLQLLQKSSRVSANLCRCIKVLVKNWQLPEVVGPKDFEDFYVLVKFYKDLRNFKREATQLSEHAQITEDGDVVQKKASGGMFFQFANSVSVAVSAAASATAQRYKQYSGV